MNAKIMLLAGLAGLSLTSHAREFKSADGSKTIDADFVRYDTRSGNVTLKLEAGRNLVTPANTFSKDDVAYFIEQQKGKEQQDAISVKTDEKSDREDNKRGNMMYKLKNSKLNFAISNSSGFDFNDLTVNYWVVVERDKKGEKSTEVVRGTEKVSSLGANGNASIEGPTVKLVQSAVSQSKSGCPRVAAAAAAVDRERILGTKIEILDATGKKIFTDTSSNRVDAHLSAGE
jgi:hypothetical protein